MRCFRTTLVLAATVTMLAAGCGAGPGGFGRTPVADTRVDPARLGASPTLDPGITRRAGAYIRPSGPYIGRPVYRAPVF